MGILDNPRVEGCLSSGYSHRGPLCCLGSIAVLLLVILLPLSFSYVEYYQYGLAQRRATGAVDTSRVYNRGRYALGPGYRMYTYQADAHHETMDSLEVFSASASNSSIGVEFRVDVDLTYLLKGDEVGDVHREMAQSYPSVILSRARDAIKNEAIFVTFTEYFENRVQVEERFRQAVQARWDEAPSLHVTLDQFHLGRIRIPEDVARKQLEARLQNERNDREDFLQEAQLEREQTAVLVNRIQLETSKILRSAQAQANLLQANARVQARELTSQATINGTALLREAANLTTQEEIAAFTYIRTLRDRPSTLDLNVGYLESENVVKTREIG